MGGNREEKLLKEILIAVRQSRGGLGGREGCVYRMDRIKRSVVTGGVRLKVAAAASLKKRLTFNKVVLGPLGSVKIITRIGLPLLKDVGVPFLKVGGA